jgi:integrase
MAGKYLVRQRADRFNIIGSPKSNAGKRTVPLAPMVVNTLKEWKLACPKGALGLVFPNPKGGVESLHAMSGGLGAAQKAAGLGGSRRAPRYGMHAFRHAAASLLIDQGVSPKRVQSFMGTRRSALEAYAAEPVAGHDVVSLKGAPGHFRLRSGDWRAIFQIVGEVVIVKRIRHRREVYR